MVVLIDAIDDIEGFGSDIFITDVSKSLKLIKLSVKDLFFI